MIRRPLALLLAVVVATTSCRRPGRSAPPKAVPVDPGGRLELRIMSFNVRYENGEDRGPRAWHQRIVPAIRMIREESPDVFGVQEARRGQAADLWASLPDYGFLGVGRDDGQQSGEYSGIFFRRDRFEPSASDRGTFWLSGTPETPGSKSWGNDIPRTATWLRLIDRATQRGFYVFNTHWDHRHQGSREQAALLLARRIDQRAVPTDPVILLGDFNAVERNPAVAYLSGKRVPLAGREAVWNHPLIDVFQTRHPAERARTTLHFWKGTRAGTLKVDHILVSGHAEILSATIRDRDQPMLSDHFPVTARVSFP